MKLFPDCLYSPLPLRKREPLEKPRDWVYLWEALATQGAAVLLESAGPVNDASRWVILAGNPEIEFFEDNGTALLQERAQTSAAPFTVSEFLDRIGNNKEEGAIQNPASPGIPADLGGFPAPHFSPLPFCLSRAWFGVLSYEFGCPPDSRGVKAPRKKNKSTPDYYFFKPKSILAYDRVDKEIFYFGEALPETANESGLVRGAFNVDSLKALSSLESYKLMAQKVKDYIAAGDIYQANIAQVFQARWKGNAGSLYGLLREMNPGPFMGLFQGRGFTVVSSSPERLAAGQGDWLETRPIAGTRPRGKDEVQDLQLQWELKTNPKEQAEHLMLVDLARNDLGKVSDFGTVAVTRFAEVESYAKVHHLVSVVQARRRSQAKISEIVRSLFPGGTITGCPKVRCMEIIEETETRTRGFYTGSMGYVAAGPSFDLNILIRSFTLFSDGTLEFCAGAGIVADSDPEKEYMETLYKVEALAQALGSSFFKKS